MRNKHDQDMSAENFRHVRIIDGKYWCGLPIQSHMPIVTTDGAVFALKRGDRVICHDCLRAIVRFIDECTGHNEVEAASMESVYEGLARTAMTIPLDATGRMLSAIGEEIRQPLERTDWPKVRQLIMSMETQVRAAGTVAQLCDAIYALVRHD